MICGIRPYDPVGKSNHRPASKAVWAQAALTSASLAPENLGSRKELLDERLSGLQRASMAPDWVLPSRRLPIYQNTETGNPFSTPGANFSHIRSSRRRPKLRLLGAALARLTDTGCRKQGGSLEFVFRRTKR